MVDGLSRFSIMGNGYGPLAEYVTYSVADREVVVRRADGTAKRVRQPFFDYLDDQLRARAVPAPAGLPFEFNLGYVGYLGYELKAETGGAAAHRADTPDAALLFADRALVLDHTDTDQLSPGPVHRRRRRRDRRRRAWLATTAQALRALPAAPADPAPARALSGPAMTDPDIGMNVELRHDRDAYLKRIDECFDEINSRRVLRDLHDQHGHRPHGDRRAAHLRPSSPGEPGPVRRPARLRRRPGRAQRIPRAVPLDRPPRNRRGEADQGHPAPGGDAAEDRALWTTCATTRRTAPRT